MLKRGSSPIELLPRLLCLFFKLKRSTMEDPSSIVGLSFPRCDRANATLTRLSTKALHLQQHGTK